MIPRKIRSLLRNGKLIIFGTANKSGEPNIIVVESCGLFKDKIVIADCQMDKTIKNLRENPLVSICLNNSKNYFQIKGKAVYFNKGNLLKLVNEINKDSNFKPKGAVLIKIKEIWDLNKCKKIM